MEVLPKVESLRFSSKLSSILYLQVTTPWVTNSRSLGDEMKTFREGHAGSPGNPRVCVEDRRSLGKCWNLVSDLPDSLIYKEIDIDPSVNHRFCENYPSVDGESLSSVSSFDDARLSLHLTGL